uniref:Sortilin N-terminal domain-containing protein n=1 Tax=Acanthochromis polyacanthus TaxID=80966 RepID=A0A3Q1FPB2_9TELE
MSTSFMKLITLHWPLNSKSFSGPVLLLIFAGDLSPLKCFINKTENGTGDGNDVALNEDGNVASWRRTRGARSAETWSGFRPEGGEDASASDQEEFQLTSSTFALTEDTAHNQAMVHWSGQNSSVILMLTKYYDFNSGRVTESSLWRSTDYGTTYEKLNEKVGTKTILSYLYVSPNNKRKVSFDARAMNNPDCVE